MAPPPHVPAARSCRASLRRLNAVAGVLAAAAAYAASLGCPGWISPLGCAEMLAVAGLILALPVWWAVAAWRDFRGAAARDARWWAWLVLPVLAGAWVLGPLRDWPLAVRIRAHETDLAAVAAEARAAPEARTAPIRRTVGGFSILHAWVRDEGVYPALCRSPDGEMGLFCADAGAPAPGRPTFMPEGQAWSTYRRVAGRWWFYDWENP